MKSTNSPPEALVSPAATISPEAKISPAASVSPEHQISDPLLAAAEAAWLEYAKGTYSETDKRIFIEGFRRGVNWQQRRVKAQARYEDDYERLYGSRRNRY